MRFPANFRFAVRTLAKSPSFALIAIVSLALGIGANTAMFSYVDAVLLRPLPVPDSGRIVEVDSTSPDTRLGRLSYADYVDLRDRTKTLQALACYDFFFAGIATRVNQVPKYGLNASVSGNFFSGLGIQPVLGRGFRPDEDTVAGRDPVAVISYHVWESEFARDRSVVGRRIRVNGSDFTVIGVSPENFTGPEAFVDPDIYIPMHAYQQAVPGASADYLTSRKNRNAVLLGRLAPGVSVAEAQSELRTIARGLAAQYPEANRDRTVTVLGYVARALRKQSYRCGFGAHTAWDYRIGPADRLRQCRESPARTRNGSREGNRRFAWRSAPREPHWSGSFSPKAFCWR